MATVEQVIADLKELPKGTQIMFDIWTELDVFTSAGLWNLEIDSKDVPNIMSEVMNGLDPDIGITFDVVSEACLTVAYPTWEYDQASGFMYNMEEDDVEDQTDWNGFEGMSPAEREAFLDSVGVYEEE